MTPEQLTHTQIEKYRHMTGEQRMLIGFSLHELSCEVARDGIRARYPDATPALVEEKLRERLRLAYSATANSELIHD